MVAAFSTFGPLLRRQVSLGTNKTAATPTRWARYAFHGSFAGYTYPVAITTDPDGRPEMLDGVAKAATLAVAVVLTCACAATAEVAAPAGSTPVQTVAPAARLAPQVGSTPASTQVEFDVGLQLRDAPGAQALAQAVSDPASPRYGHYLTSQEWEARFSPSEAAVATVTSWLRSHGISVQEVMPDRMTVVARGSVSAIENAFATQLAQFRVGRRTLRLAKTALQVPSSIGSLVSGVTGVNESPVRPSGLTGAAEPRTGSRTPRTLPPAFVVGKPCSAYWAQKLATSLPPYGSGYPEPLPYAPCGYTPSQIQGAYGVSGTIASGTNGKGRTVAIVDALASPTLFEDARTYSLNNQPGAPLEAGQFKELLNKPFEVSETCIAEEEWANEQHLDVEAVHATAPGARILYVGAKTCTNASLENAVQQVVDGKRAEVVTDSWGTNTELEPEESRKAFDNVLLMADATGIGVQFSSGDEGDEFIIVGANIPSYPAASPYATAVGGTSLEVGRHNERLGEFGWSTGRSLLCTSTLAELESPGCTKGKLESWLPPAPGEYLYGGGGGTSMVYPEPSYQEAVVPAALAERYSSLTGERNRVVPDISMDGDPSTGFLVGEMQEFPSGPRYNEYRLGGTSLSSPLLAGLIADADQAAGKSLGFINPRLYKLDSLPSTAASAFFDVVPGGKQAMARVDYLNEINAREGVRISARTIEYEGRQEYCDEAGACEHEKNILSTGPGFDSMTGIGSPGEGFIAKLSGR